MKPIFNHAYVFICEAIEGFIKSSNRIFRMALWKKLHIEKKNSRNWKLSVWHSSFHFFFKWALPTWKKKSLNFGLSQLIWMCLQFALPSWIPFHTNHLRYNFFIIDSTKIFLLLWYLSNGYQLPNMTQDTEAACVLFILIMKLFCQNIMDLWFGFLPQEIRCSDSLEHLKIDLKCHIFHILYLKALQFTSSMFGLWNSLAFELYITAL